MPTDCCSNPGTLAYSQYCQNMAMTSPRARGLVGRTGSPSAPRKTLELPCNYNGAYYAVDTWYKRRSEHPNSRPIKSVYGQCTFLFTKTCSETTRFLDHQRTQAFVMSTCQLCTLDLGTSWLVAISKVHCGCPSTSLASSWYVGWMRCSSSPKNTESENSWRSIINHLL